MAALARTLLVACLVLPRVALTCEPSSATGAFDGLCAVVSGPCERGPHIAVFSAFPAEQRALRDAAEVSERLEIEGRPVLLGWLAGQRVALTLTGIGLVNATAAATALLTRLDVSAAVFSGVAGSTGRIGDVIVPATWTYEATGRTFAVDPALLAAARAVASRPPVLGRCTPVPPDPPGATVCLDHGPGVAAGGSGASSDDFGGNALPCQPGGGEVFGCDASPFAAPRAEGAPDAVDMESAAVAEVAAAQGIPFVAVRGVSDGAGDPLGLAGFPAQFFAYYRLAADNAAVVVMQLLRELSAVGAPPRRRGRARPRAACAFAAAAAPACRGVRAPRAVAALVSRACALRVRAAAAGPAGGARLARRAAARWRRAAARVDRGALPPACSAALAARLRAAAASACGRP